MAYRTTYQFELWSAAGTPIADITRYVQNLYWTEERNEAEVLQFSMDLDAFEDYMTNYVRADPVSNFTEGQTEIKVKENGSYLFGTQLYYAPINLNNDGSATISVVAQGYLNFFDARYPDPAISYSATESVEIFYDLVRKAQAVTYGNYGIIIPSSGYYTTGILRDRTFEKYTSSTKLNMQRLTSLADGNFDFKFLADKTLMTYNHVGSPRSDFVLYVDRKNFRSSLDKATLNRGANNLYNQVIGQGTGLGTDMMLSIKDDLPSQNAYKLRQMTQQFNEVKVQTTLDNNTQAALNQSKDLLRMPQITLSGADLPTVPLQIGDIIPIKMTGRKLLEDMTGYYRIERKEVHLDENQFISEMTLYFTKTGTYTG